jgi:hypothetical protein
MSSSTAPASSAHDLEARARRLLAQAQQGADHECIKRELGEMLAPFGLRDPGLGANDAGDVKAGAHGDDGRRWTAKLSHDGVFRMTPRAGTAQLPRTELLAERDRLIRASQPRPRTPGLSRPRPGVRASHRSTRRTARSRAARRSGGTSEPDQGDPDPAGRSACTPGRARTTGRRRA